MADPDPKPDDDLKPEPTLIEQEGAVPETVVPVEEVEPEPVVEAKAEEPKVEEVKVAPKQKPWFIKQLDEIKRAKADSDKRAQELETTVKLLRQGLPDGERRNPNGDADPLAAGLTRADWDKQVSAEAQKIVQQQAWESKAKSWIDAGTAEFGQAEFNEKCDMVAALGASERPEFRQMIVDPDVIPDGHKVVARLADNPEEAQRILSIQDPMKLASALTKFAMTAPKEPTKVSSAPKPIGSNVGGSAKPSAPSDNEDIKSWMAKRNATARKSAGGKPMH